MSGSIVLPPDFLEKVKDTALFYPCSGNDLMLPIQLFSPYVTDFWFVDRGYFRPGHCDTKQYGYDVSADTLAPILSGNENYELKSKSIDGPVTCDAFNPEIEACVLSEVYRHKESNREIRIHRRRGYGFSAFKNVIHAFGVFFYRGDSQGDGGSGNYWFAPEHFESVLAKLVDGGLIVTDGSKNDHSTAYSEFSKKYFTEEECGLSPHELIKTYSIFKDSINNKFTCVGYVGHRYGPTLVWQVNKSTNS
jgi:hypothetical protein